MNYPTINTSEETLALEYSKFFQTSSISLPSSIDHFYNECTNLVKLTDQLLLEENPSLSRLLILGFVSLVEEYLRSIFCEIINICPQAKLNVSEQKIKFSSIDYYGLLRMAEGLFEENSFASQKEIKSQSSSILGFNINPTSSIGIALQEFNKVCHLRHCAVHGAGKLNAHNAKELGLKDTLNHNEHKRLIADSTAVQEALKICYSFVRAFNQNLFQSQIEKWKGKEIKGSWKQEEGFFSQAVRAFWSLKDMGEEPDIRGIYKTIIPIKAPKDIYPEDERNHKLMKKILTSFIFDFRLDGQFLHQIDSLALEELSAMFEVFYFYDDIETFELLEYIFNESKNAKTLIASIRYYLLIFEDTIGKFNVGTYEKENDQQLLSLSISNVISKFNIQFNQIYPLLICLDYSQIESFIYLHEIIKHEEVLLEMDKRGYTDVLINSETVDVLDIIDKIFISSIFSITGKHGGHVLEDIIVIINYSLDENGELLVVNIDVEI